MNISAEINTDSTQVLTGAGRGWGIPDGDGWNSAWAPYAALNRVTIGISSSPELSVLSDFNPTINHTFDGAGVWNSRPGYSTAGDWYGGLEGMTNTAMTLDNLPGFGWDFEMSGPSPSLFTIDMAAIIAWSGELDRYDPLNGYYEKLLVSNSESYGKSYSIPVIPEPASMTLIGLGLVGLGLLKRKK